VPRSLGFFLAFGLVACGPARDALDDVDPSLNDPHPVGMRRMACTTCPNGGKDLPQAPQFGPQIDAYASYVGQTKCDPTAKPGAVAFMNLVLATYPCTGSSGITRACNVGGTSEHKEGRAWDWKIQYPHPAADTFLGWLLATDKHGNKHAMARRLGVMYMVWNNKIWSSYKASQGWRPYTGSNPHTDHVHFSFSWDGANKKTTFWTSPLPPADSGPPPAPDAKVPAPDAKVPAPDAKVPPPPPPKADSGPRLGQDAQGGGQGDGQQLPPGYHSPDNPGDNVLRGGCALGRKRGLGPAWLLALGLLLLLRRRKRL
jgi:hypothetical protein